MKGFAWTLVLKLRYKLTRNCLLLHSRYTSESCLLELYVSLLDTFLNKRVVPRTKLGQVLSCSGLWDKAQDNRQLLDEVEHDITNYKNQGLCYLLKPSASADNTDTRF